MPKVSLKKNNRFHTFPKGISPKVNIIVQLEFELAYINVTIQHIGHDDTETPLTLNLFT